MKMTRVGLLAAVLGLLAVTCTLSEDGLPCGGPNDEPCASTETCVNGRCAPVEATTSTTVTSGSGGMAGAGGMAGTGGLGGAGGTGGTGGMTCDAQTEKVCDGQCVTKTPENGCSSPDCSPCEFTSVVTYDCGAPGGACGIVSCDQGSGDCDGKAANGCETVTKNNHDACGGCGIVCAPQEQCLVDKCVIPCVACNLGESCTNGQCEGPCGVVPHDAMHWWLCVVNAVPPVADQHFGLSGGMGASPEEADSTWSDPVAFVPGGVCVASLTEGQQNYVLCDLGLFDGGPDAYVQTGDHATQVAGTNTPSCSGIFCQATAVLYDPMGKKRGELFANGNGTGRVSMTESVHFNRPAIKVYGIEP